MKNNETPKQVFERNRQQRNWVITAILVAVVIAVFAGTLFKGPGFINDRAAAGVKPLR